MRELVLCLVLAACGSKKASDDVKCVDAIDKLAERIGDPKSKEAASLIGTCEQRKWTAAQRRCVADAKDARAAASCIEDEADLLGPVPVASPETQALVAKLKPPLRVIAFMSPSPALDHIKAYFKPLGITVEVLDRLVEPERAMSYRMTTDGLVLIRDASDGERSQTIAFDSDTRRAARQLPRLDSEVAVAVAKLSREKRKLYLTRGHGELADRLSKFDQAVAEANFVRAELPADALAQGVPADATIVAIFAPTTAFSAAEQSSIAAYLDRGGSLLLAFDPKSVSSMGLLDDKLGVKGSGKHLTDDKSFLPQRRTLADRRLVLTNNFSAHPISATIARSSATQGLVLIDSSALEVTAPKATVAVRSLETSFLEFDDNFTFDAGKEMRAKYAIVVAVELGAARAVVTADVDLFSDVLTQNAGRNFVVMIGGPLVTDSLRWLGKDEAMLPLPVPEQHKAPPPSDDEPIRYRFERL
jgi:hypothetical protein